MPEGFRQLVLDLPVTPRFGADDFLVSASNEAAFRFMESWPGWPGPFALLVGPAGSGKSHLASVWADRAGAPVVPARAVGAEIALPSLAAAHARALVLEDLHAGPLDEGALFHLVNLTRERRGFLLATSARPVDRLGLRTPDLLSRLRLAPSLTLGLPDDALLKAVLVKLFVDRQVAVDAGTVEYLAARIERSLAAAAAAVAALDGEALSRGRRVTRHMAREVLAFGAGEDGEDEDGVTEPS